MLSSLMKNTYLNMSSKFMKYPKALNECESHISMTLDTWQVTKHTAQAFNPNVAVTCSLKVDHSQFIKYSSLKSYFSTKLYNNVSGIK